LVPGSVILIGGDPGIGKSTLLLQMLAGLLQQMKCLYVTGEESLQQVGLRAKRLGLSADHLACVTETSVNAVLELAESERPQLMVIDSIQTLYSEDVASAPGSVSQVRESAAGLVRYAKQNDCAVILVGHVTSRATAAAATASSGRSRTASVPSMNWVCLR
jgi:DNA repair protein RadA/Sms